MKCPACGSTDDKVIESRTINEGEAIRRRRECNSCSHRFTSYERLEPMPVMVVKKNNVREAFDIEKVQKGIMKAIEKRPIEMSKVEALLAKVEKFVYDQNINEISSKAIGNLIMSELKKLDGVAYVRFASVYKQFKTLDEFIEAVNKLS